MLSGSLLARARAFSITFFMSSGARNWPFLMFTGLPAARDGADEVGLAAQERRRLQHVDHRRHLGDLVLGVHVGQHRHAELLLAPRPGSRRPFSMPGPRNDAARAAVGLVVATLEDERNAERRRDLLQLAGDVHLQLLGFDHAGPGDEEERPVEPDLEAAELHASRRRAVAGDALRRAALARCRACAARARRG